MTNRSAGYRWLWAVAACLAASTLLASCAGRQGIRRVKAQYRLGKRRVLVVPFRQDVLSYFESKTGLELADAIVGFLQVYDKRLRVLSGARLPGSIRSRQYTQESLADAARQVGADTVLEGSILDLQTREPRSPNLLRGRIAVEFHLRDVNQWDKPLFSRRVAYSYPEDLEYSHLLMSDATPRQVMDHLIALCGERIAQCFVDHDELKE